MDDLLSIKIEKSKEWNNDVISIYVNSKNLVEILREFENQFSSDLAGAYEGFNSNFIKNIKKHFLGLDDRYKTQDGKTWILGCECGEPGCWPFAVLIIVDEDVITWRDFKQPYRKEWDYCNMQSFTFERKAYEKELERIAKEMKQNPRR